MNPTKSKSLKKITALFHNKGYSSTSMEDIVFASGLNRSSIYNTFGSKLDLFINCFEANEMKYKRDIQKVILSSETPSKSIKTILEISVNETYNGYLIPNYFSEIKNEEPSIRKLIANQKEYLFDLFEDLIKTGQSSGAINNSKSSKQYASYLLTFYQGLQTMKAFKNDAINLENTIYDALSLL